MPDYITGGRRRCTLEQAQLVLSALLDAEGFAAMARDVRQETHAARLRQYARIAERNGGHARPEISKRLRVLGLV